MKQVSLGRVKKHRKGILVLILFFCIMLIIAFLAQQYLLLLRENQKLRQAKDEFYSAHVSSTGNTFIANLTSSDIHYMVNVERTRAGLEQLAYNETLERSACSKADDMIANNYWAHVSPSGVEPWAFIRQEGIYYRSAGENLGYGFATGDAVVTGWMNSPSHRANILSNQYTAEGICVRHAARYMNMQNQQVVVQHLYSEL